MADTESLRQVAHGRTPLSAWFGIVLLFALFGVIVLAIIGPAPRGSDYEEARAKKRVENLKTVRGGSRQGFDHLWLDRQKQRRRSHPDRACHGIDSCRAGEAKAGAGRSDRYARGASNCKRSSECHFPGPCYVSETRRRTSITSDGCACCTSRSGGL